MTQYLPFLAVLAPFTLFWTQSKALFKRIFSVLWKSKTLELHESVLLYKFLSQYKHTDLGNYSLKPVCVFNKNGTYLKKYVRTGSVEIFLYKNFIPVFVTAASSCSALRFSYINFTFPFLKIFLKLTEDVRTKSNKSYGGSFYVDKITGNRFQSGVSMSNYSSQNSIVTSSPSPNLKSEVDVLVDVIDPIGFGTGRLADKDDIKDFSWNLKKENKDNYVYTEKGLEIKSIVEKWSKAEKWYIEKNIRYYRGCFLTSSPGSGKSSLIKKIAQDLNIPLLIVDLSSFENKKFEEIIDSFNYQKAILLFEDIDTVFKGRENLTKTDQSIGLTFDCFINQLSGVTAIKNKFVFITSNQPADYFDSALLRPGRCDHIIEYPNGTIEDKRKMAEFVLETGINKVLEEGKDDSMAEFEARITSEALNRFWA